ncbi:uncharacterized protein MEPE_03148 [Melanopsichium pennsylvanicum]|uniref:Uncharacterized protein n=1 Tax=Melanopsichium pennsylvanicum TaxID=63383 RepID=A0AAJ4XLA0_9BASI|nr:uncharacterized protein MEPE_03148 [Melanopsichium pennsylvanicum]
MTMITAFLETGSGDFKLCRAKNNTQAALSATNCSQCHKLILRHRPVGADGPVKACLSDDGRPRTRTCIKQQSFALQDPSSSALDLVTAGTGTLAVKLTNLTTPQ